MIPSEWAVFQQYVFALEGEGHITRTFRRLDPDRQQAVLSAILEEAVEKGPTEINIKRVAERAGVSVGALYTYFGKRESLIDFVVLLCARTVNMLLESSRPYLLDLSLAEGLTLYIQGGMEMNQIYQGLLRFFARAAYHSESELGDRVVRPTAVIMRTLVHDMLIRAIARGEVRPHIDVEATSRVIHGLTIVYGDSQLFPYLNTYFQMSDHQVSADRTLSALISLILRGIGIQQTNTPSEQ